MLFVVLGLSWHIGCSFCCSWNPGVCAMRWNISLVKTLVLMLWSWLYSMNIRCVLYFHDNYVTCLPPFGNSLLTDNEYLLAELQRSISAECNWKIYAWTWAAWCDCGLVVIKISCYFELLRVLWWKILLTRYASSGKCLSEFLVIMIGCKMLVQHVAEGVNPVTIETVLL